VSIRFDHPPIHELALSVQFGALPGLTTAHLGAIWQEHFKARFPQLQEHEPLQGVVERYLSGPAHHEMKFQLGREAGRVWFLSSGGQQLLQVQTDRFVCNWRRSAEQPYLGFAQVLDVFTRELRVFVAALPGGEGPVFTQCELTYVSHAVAGEGFSGHSELDRVVRGWTWPALPQGITPERMALRGSYVCGDGEGEPWARVHQVVNPVSRVKDKTPLLAIEITARGAPLAAGLEGVVAFLEKAHCTITNVFLASTTEHIHGVWGRRDD